MNFKFKNPFGGDNSAEAAALKNTKNRKIFYDSIDKVFITNGVSAINQAISALGITLIPRNVACMIFVITATKEGKESVPVKIYNPKQVNAGNVAIFIEVKRSESYNILNSNKRIVRVIDSDSIDVDNGMIKILPSLSNCFIEGV